MHSDVDFFFVQVRLIFFLFSTRQVKFQSTSNGGVKRVAEEEIVEVEDLAAKQQKTVFSDAAKKGSTLTIGSFKKPQPNRSALSQKSVLANLVKRKPNSTTTSASTSTSSTAEITHKATTESATSSSGSTTQAKPSTTPAPAPTAVVSNSTNGLSLLSGYDCSDSDESE